MPGAHATDLVQQANHCRVSRAVLLFSTGAGAGGTNEVGRLASDCRPTRDSITDAFGEEIIFESAC